MRLLPSIRRMLGAFTQNARVAVAVLSLSAAGFVAILEREG